MYTTEAEVQRLLDRIAFIAKHELSASLRLLLGGFRSVGRQFVGILASHKSYPGLEGSILPS